MYVSGLKRVTRFVCCMMCFPAYAISLKDDLVLQSHLALVYVLSDQTIFCIRILGTHHFRLMQYRITGSDQYPFWVHILL